MSDDIHSIEVDGEVGEHVTDLRAENERLRAALRQAYLNTRGQIGTAEELVRAITLASADIGAALKENSDG